MFLAQLAFIMQGVLASQETLVAEYGSHRIEIGADRILLAVGNDRLVSQRGACNEKLVKDFLKRFGPRLKPARSSRARAFRELAGGLPAESEFQRAGTVLLKLMAESRAVCSVGRSVDSAPECPGCPPGGFRECISHMCAPVSARRLDLDAIQKRRDQSRPPTVKMPAELNSNLERVLKHALQQRLAEVEGLETILNDFIGGSVSVQAEPASTAYYLSLFTAAVADGEAYDRLAPVEQKLVRDLQEAFGELPSTQWIDRVSALNSTDLLKILHPPLPFRQAVAREARFLKTLLAKHQREQSAWRGLFTYRRVTSTFDTEFQRRLLDEKTVLTRQDLTRLRSLIIQIRIFEDMTSPSLRNILNRVSAVRSSRAAPSPYLNELSRRLAIEREEIRSGGALKEAMAGCSDMVETQLTFREEGRKFAAARVAAELAFKGTRDWLLNSFDEPLRTRLRPRVMGFRLEFSPSREDYVVSLKKKIEEFGAEIGGSVPTEMDPAFRLAHVFERASLAAFQEDIAPLCDHASLMDEMSYITGVYPAIDTLFVSWPDQLLSAFVPPIIAHETGHILEVSLEGVQLDPKTTKRLKNARQCLATNQEDAAHRFSEDFADAVMVAWLRQSPPAKKENFICIYLNQARDLWDLVGLDQPRDMEHSSLLYRALLVQKNVLRDVPKSCTTQLARLAKPRPFNACFD